MEWKGKEKQRKRTRWGGENPTCVNAERGRATQRVHTLVLKRLIPLRGLVSMAGVAVVREALDSPNGAAADMQSTLHSNTAGPGRRTLVNESMRGDEEFTALLSSLLDQIHR